MFSFFHLYSEKLIDWLKDLRWIMIPEEKKIPLIIKYFETLQTSALNSFFTFCQKSWLIDWFN